MATTSQTENILGLSKKDLSLIRHSLEAGGKLIHQVINGLKHGTSEVQQLILQQSDVILECRVCRNLFRSLPNYLDHKRIYCQELFPNASVSLLASPFADEVPIIYPEPPDDAKEFVEMSDLISKLNSKRNLEQHVEMTSSLCKNKAYVQNPSGSIGGTLEQSRHKRKLQPLYLQPIQETNVAMKLVPLNTNKTTENKNLMGLTYKKREEATDTSCEKKSSATKSSPPRNVSLRLLKMANFHKLLCLKCNQRYSTKYRLVSHINKFHLKVKLRKYKENGRNVDNGTKAGSNKVSKQTKKEATQNNIDVFSTKSGQPSLKKISYLAKTSNMAVYSEMKKGWCHICNQSYSGKRGLVFHMFRMHSGIRKIYPCLFCKVKSPSFASALRHTQTVHNCKKSDMKNVVKRLKASGHVENQQWQSLLEPKISVEKCDTQMTRFLQSNPVTPQRNPKTRPLSDQAENDTSLTTSQQKSAFRCQICHQIFSGNRGLRHHITRKHSIKQKPPENPYSCRICFMEFFTSFSLKRHYRLKHNLQETIQENKPKMEIKVEATMHNEETSDSHLDENCFDQKSSDSVLDKNCLFHNNRKYPIPLKYYKTVSKYAHFPSLCLNCNQKFSGARDLIRHIIRMHCTYKNAFPCPFCHLSFISSVSILRHTKVQHSCSDQEIADLNQKLQVWEQQKRNNLDYKIRKKAVSNSSTVSDSSSEEQSNADSVPFQEPSSIHDVTNFQAAKCLHCNQKLSGIQELIKHINKTHTAISNQTHQCFKCNVTFESVFTIVEHMEKIHNIFLKQKRLNPQRTTMNKLLETTSSTKASLSIDKETSEENCKLEKACGEDAQNSKLVMQCADFLRSRCLKCEEIFSGKRGLIAHIYKNHGYYGHTYSCYLCLKTFSSFALACQHTRSSHIYKGTAMTYIRVNNIKEETDK